MRGRVATGVGKTDAISELARQAGLQDVNPHVHETVESVLDRLRAALGGDANPTIRFVPSAGLRGATEQVWFPAHHREVALPRFANGRPDSFPERQGSEDSPALVTLTLEDGLFAQVGRAALTLLPDARTAVADYSSRFAGLVGFYDIDMAAVLAAPHRIAGTALVLADDIFPINFCHWMVDTLPRLACLGERRDVTVVVSDIDVPFKRESLRLAGVPGDRVVYLPDFRAVRADTLMVPHDTRDMPHPAHKAAPWVMDFLRARVGLPAVLAAPGAPRPRKLYVSRADAGGRRVLNEDALMRVLAPLGYEPATLSGRSVAEQVALFSCADRVVGLHGAGLTNIAFCPSGARLLEIFPASYGMATYYVLSAGQGMGYASYIARDVRPGERDQVDDVVIDVADFMRCCGDLL